MCLGVCSRYPNSDKSLRARAILSDQFADSQSQRAALAGVAEMTAGYDRTRLVALLNARSLFTNRKAGDRTAYE